MDTQAVVQELDFVQIDRHLVALAVEALESAKRSGKKIVTAEFCTGGLIATVLSEAPGAVDHFDGAYVTYTPDQKCAALRLNRDLIEASGAVSGSVAIAMIARHRQAIDVSWWLQCADNAQRMPAIGPGSRSDVTPVANRLKGFPTAWPSSGKARPAGFGPDGNSLLLRAFQAC